MTKFVQCKRTFTDQTPSGKILFFKEGVPDMIFFNRQWFPVCTKFQTFTRNTNKIRTDFFNHTSKNRKGATPPMDMILRDTSKEAGLGCAYQDLLLQLLILSVDKYLSHITNLQISIFQYFYQFSHNMSAMINHNISAVVQQSCSVTAELQLASAILMLGMSLKCYI